MTSTSSGSGRSRFPQRRTATPPRPDADYPTDDFDVDDEPGQRRGAHRTATPAVLEQLPFLVVALVVVVAIVVAFGLLTGGDDPGSAAPAGTPGASAGSDPAATGETSAPPAETTAPPATSQPPATSSPAPTADRSVPLVVLNGTSTTGLAGEVGAELEELGWTVETVGNAPAPVEASVVLYSDPEQQATAEAVAADLDATAELDDSVDGQVVVVLGADRA